MRVTAVQACRLLAAALLAAACTPTSEPERREEVGAVLVSWSEADHEELGEVDRSGPLLVEDEATLDDVVAGWPDTLDTAALDDVDLDASVLVVDAWPRCQQWSRLLVDADRTTLTVQVVEPRELVSCAWSPVRLDVWQVDRSDLGDGGLRLTGRVYGQDAGGGRVTCPDPDRC